jgi:cellulose synthase/poly-beta-1,6-N-acetylglucosamine synthase-like glycosyltransferase
VTGARLDTPNVSVLIPAFNMDRVLETAVASALDQDGVTVEVVVIDDASTDGTPDLVAGMARKDARVHPVRLQENAGPGAARSAGPGHRPVATGLPCWTPTTGSRRDDWRISSHWPAPGTSTRWPTT